MARAVIEHLVGRIADAGSSRVGFTGLVGNLRTLAATDARRIADEARFREGPAVRSCQIVTEIVKTGRNVVKGLASQNSAWPDRVALNQLVGVRIHAAPGGG